MNSKEVLLEYFNIFKNLDSTKSNAKDIDKYIDSLTKHKYLDKLDFIEKIVKGFDVSIVLQHLKNEYNINEDNQNISLIIKDIYNNYTKGVDNVLLDILSNIGKYNAGLKKNKEKNTDYNVNKDISFDEVNIELKDILNYLDVSHEEIDKKLLFDLNKFGDINKLKNMASEIKTDLDIGYILYDKINDKNTLLSLLLHSNMTIIKNVCNVCKNRGLNLNKFIGEPSIFIDKTINSKCKYQVPAGYNNFIQNIDLCIKNNIDLKRMSNGHCVFFVNDYVVNINNLEKLKEKNVNIKHVLENVGGIFTINFDLILSNIDILRIYGIELTDDNCNNGYTILGMSDLAEKLDYHIEKGLWKKSNGNNLDNMDLTKGLRIKDNYISWKNNYKKENKDVELEKEFSKNNFSEEKLISFFEKNPVIKEYVEKLDNDYLNKEEGYYSIGFNIVSRLRILRNICNYKGKSTDKEMFEKVVKYNANISDIESIFNVINLEKGDRSVKLSKGL